MRRVTGEGFVEGDIEGEVDFIENIGYNFNTQAGHIYGKQNYYVTLNSTALEGGFEGSLFGLISGPLSSPDLEYDYVGYGNGDFEGMKFFQTCVGDDGNNETCEGYILDPHETLEDNPCD